MGTPKRLMDEGTIAQALDRVVREVLERNPDATSLAVVGVHTRGVALAYRLHDGIRRATGRDVPLGTLDITLYRDDMDAPGARPVVRGTDIRFDLEGRNVLLVDDVLYTGRTTRAALSELADFGRPRTIQLAVLVDRGHRELPIQPDYVGMRISTRYEDTVRVHLKEMDASEEVILIEP